MMLMREAAHADTATLERGAAPHTRTICYVAATPAGPVLLEMDAHARHAADAAVFLQRADALLCALQRWTGVALDWRWIDDRRNPTLDCELAMQHAPASWARWVKDGRTALSRVRRRVLSSRVKTGD